MAKFKDGQIETYLKGTLDELSARVEEMNFERFFDSSRNKLMMVDEFIERERRVLEENYQKLSKDTDQEEAVLDAKVGSLVKYVETLKGEIDSNY